MHIIFIIQLGKLIFVLYFCALYKASNHHPAVFYFLCTSGALKYIFINGNLIINTQHPIFFQTVIFFDIVLIINALLV